MDRNGSQWIGMELDKPNKLQWTEIDRGGPKNYTYIVQQKRSNKKYYTSAFKYYIYEVMFTFF